MTTVSGSDMSGRWGWAGRIATSLHRHARPCAGHPRLHDIAATKTWMAGSSPAMTWLGRSVWLLGPRLRGDERRELLRGLVSRRLRVSRLRVLGRADD